MILCFMRKEQACPLFRERGEIDCFAETHLSAGVPSESLAWIRGVTVPRLMGLAHVARGIGGSPSEGMSTESSTQYAGYRVDGSYTPPPKPLHAQNAVSNQAQRQTSRFEADFRSIAASSGSKFHNPSDI
jgi:hypothetical protein